MDELLQHYNDSGRLLMIVQEFIEWEHYVRCIVLGQQEVLPMKYDPAERKHHIEHEHLTAELGRRIVDDSLRLVRALGYDMNAIEWAVRAGVPYAIDFMNPAPEMDIYSLPPHYFDWTVEQMAEMSIRFARDPRPQARELRWSSWFTGSRPGAVSPGSAAGTATDALPESPTAGEAAGDLAEELPSLARDLPRTEIEPEDETGASADGSRQR